MGCFSGTCMLSNLPINQGDKVKLVFIERTRSKFECLSGICYPTDVFSPKFLPIEGEYDDYGSIENIVKDWNYLEIEKSLRKSFKKIKNDRMTKKELEKFTLEDIIYGIGSGDLEVFQKGDSFMKNMAVKAYKIYSEGGYTPEKVLNEWKALAEEDISEKWRTPKLSFVLIRKDIWDGIIKDYNMRYELKPEDMLRPYAGSLEIFDILKTNSVKMFSLMNSKKHFELWSEIVKINSFMQGTRKSWMPQSGSGSQYNEFTEHLILNNLINTVIKNENDKKR